MTAPQPRSPALTVVVAVTGGSAHLDGCLAALERQDNPPDFEIVVPIDDSLPDAPRWIETHPSVRFPRIEGAAASTAANPDGQRHLAYDRRRAAGIAGARAPIVALTEDHARPAPDWCQRIDDAHRAHSHPVIGGAIVDGNRGAIARAVFLCDFGRYRPPLRTGPANFVSDVNVSYKASALTAIADTWRDGYHETAVHGAIRRRGGTLWLEPSIVVEQHRGPMALWPSLRERYAWGRLYAGKRTREVTRLRHILLALLSPLLPFVLFVRQLRSALRHPRSGTTLLLPLVALLLCAWSLGETVGYWTGRPVGGTGDR